MAEEKMGESIEFDGFQSNADESISVEEAKAQEAEAEQLR